MTAWTGYSTPSRFSDPLEEYWAVRQRVGVCPHAIGGHEAITQPE